MVDVINKLVSSVDIKLISALAALAATVLVAEILVRRNKIQGENSRKFIHIIGGLVIGLSAFYLNEVQLLIICGLLTGGILVLELPFHVIHSVETIKRKTVGQYVFAVGIALVLMIYESRALFMAATLTMTLADGLAAVVGAKYGKRQYRFHIPGGYKTYLGSITFFVVFCYISIIFRC